MDPHTRYERISDIVYPFGRGIVLRFNVSLAKYSQTNERIFYYKEYEYANKNDEMVVSIKRNYEYFLTLENTKNKDAISTMITMRDFPRLKQALHRASAWYTDAEFAKLFVMKQGRLVLTSPIPRETIDGLIGGHSIIIEPIIIDSQRFIKKVPGVCIRDEMADVITSMSFDDYMGFLFTIDSINMISMAQAMLAAIPHEPINRVKLSDELGSQPKKPKQFKQSFFNRKMDEIDEQEKLTSDGPKDGRRIGGGTLE